MESQKQPNNADKKQGTELPHSSELIVDAIEELLIRQIGEALQLRNSLVQLLASHNTVTPYGLDTRETVVRLLSELSETVNHSLNLLDQLKTSICIWTVLQKITNSPTIIVIDTDGNEWVQQELPLD